MIVEVVAAVILRADGAFLLAKRPPGKVYAGWWEFPGGKVEAGEPPAQALARELHEELGIEVRASWPWITRVFTYPHATVRLNFYRVTDWAGEPQPKEGQSLSWQRLDEPLLEPMLPANAPIIASLGLPTEYAISAAHSMGEQAFMRRLEERLERGLKLVQVREHDLSRDALSALAKRTARLARRYGARVLVPQGLLVGASCHASDELARAMELGLDFVVLGPVQPTGSHPGAATLGWDGFAALARGATLPVYALGGLVRSDMEPAWRAGAHGIAMISGAWRIQ
ncbi:MAG: bifunctional MutT family pyrophosphohydrolase/thiamine phosphate synthase [Proteobacteria bacterium]|nr:bifunctional MutT family pyrophosphohydrolase/thiamine phosphate synthase [Pseudomonadota bacterium]